MNITVSAAAKLLRDHDNIVLLAHQKPDGDTLGSCFALLFALESLGKTARVECADGFPERYHIFCGGYTPKAFTPDYLVACDVAGNGLLGVLAEAYPVIHLCIDHHKSNSLFAQRTLLDPMASAVAEIIYHIILQLGIRPDKQMATALYAGISTDTGCFRFSNVTASTHRIAAELVDCGAQQPLVNKLMFDNKSRGRIEVEKLMMRSLDFSHDGRCVVISLPADVYSRFGVTEDELDGIAAFPRRIEGVLCGVTIRQQPDGSSRVSLRCDPPLDASAICARFGGGGHTAAAGCTLTGPPEEVRTRLVEAVGNALEQTG